METCNEKMVTIKTTLSREQASRCRVEAEYLFCYRRSTDVGYEGYSATVDDNISSKQQQQQQPGVREILIGLM